MTKKRTTTPQLIEERQRVAKEVSDKQTELATIEHELVKRAFSILGRDTEDLYRIEISYTWGCTDPRNETKGCIFDDYDDECHDFCLFCGKPEERK